MNLYPIIREHIALMAQIEEQDGEIMPHQEMALGFTLDAFQEKAVSAAFLTKHLDDTSAAIDAEIKRLQKLKAQVERNEDWLKDQISAAMQQFGIERIETPTLKLSFRKSEAIEISDESKLPESVKDEVPATFKISKTKIKEQLKMGIEVPGASLVTRQNLQIK